METPNYLLIRLFGTEERLFCFNCDKLITAHYDYSRSLFLFHHECPNSSLPVPYLEFEQFPKASRFKVFEWLEHVHMAENPPQQLWTPEGR